MNLKNTRGFTLIELLVVIVIIGILATLGIQTFTGAQAKARDTQRISNVQALESAVEQYYQQYGEYPSGTPSTSAVAAGATAVNNWATLATELKPYLSTMPTDPKNGQGTGMEQFVYTYHVWNSASGISNQVYLISAHMESDANYQKHNLGTAGAKAGRIGAGSISLGATGLQMSGIAAATCNDADSCSGAAATNLNSGS